MRYVAAYLLAALGGKENPNSSDIKKILESVGIEADQTRMEKVGRGVPFRNPNIMVSTEMYFKV